MINGSCLPNALLAVSITMNLPLRSLRASLPIVLLLLAQMASGQYWMDINSPSQASPCVDYPIEITLYNDDGDATSSSLFTLDLPEGFSYIPGSVDGIIGEEDLSDPEKIIFRIPVIPQCESVDFILWLSHECIESPREKDITGSWEARRGSGIVPNAATSIRLFGLALRLYDLNIYFDSTDLEFKKSFTLINTGQVPLESFVFYIEGEDNMDILTTNFGRLSSNGDTIYFDQSDFQLIGNNNDLFEPGEELHLIQEIDLDACNEAFPFVHRMIVPCGRKTCSYEVASDTELKVTIGTPRLLIRQMPDQKATPCDTGFAELKLVGWSTGGSFPQGNALYDLVLNTGWSIIQNNRRTPPRRDNCLRIVVAEIEGTEIPIRTQGFSGYGLDLTRLTSDPDGPGGLTDIDGDGRYDDVFAGDTVCIRLKYLMDESCLNIRCSGVVFDSRILRLESDYRDYCGEDGESDSYISRHNYYWAGYGGSISGLDGVYVDGDADTLLLNLGKSISGFLDSCGNDSAIVRVNFPRVVELPDNAIITVNGDTIDYTYSGRRLTFGSDTSRMRVVIPIEVMCDPGAGGNIQTACTFCLGSGFPKHRINFEMDYICDDGCIGSIPLICDRSPEFVAVCDSAAAGIISEGKFVMEDMAMFRESFGYEDKDGQNKITSASDSLDLNTLIAFDTFRLEIPFDIRCDANYNNVIFKLIQSAIITINGTNRDTLKYFEFLSDTLKFYDGETDRWSTCINPLSNEFYNTRNDGYRNNYVQEVNLSQLGCLNGNFSSQDSMIFIIKGRVRNTLRNNVQRLFIRSDLQYSQDGCNQNDRKIIQFNVFSGVPHPGSVFVSPPYVRDTNYSRYYSELSVCGDFELNVAVDNIYYNVDTIDPFLNEYRNLFELNRLKVIIPDFFHLDSLPFNYITEFYRSSKRAFTRDTSKLPYTVYDSAGHHVVNFNVSDVEDFFAIRQNFRLNLIPDCYGFVNDSIQVIKYMRIQTHSSSPIPRDTIYEQFFPLNILSLDPVFENPRQQFLYDSISVTEFELRTDLDNHVPEEYFDFHYTWMTLEHLGHVMIDSLVEYTDSTSKVWTPEILGQDHYAYKLDSTFTTRKFRLHSRVVNCQRDTLKFDFGNSCSGYPIDLADIQGNCEKLQESRSVFILPETPDIQIKFLSTPDSLHSTPCDTFIYEVEVRNSDLGHLSDHILVVDEVPGMTYLDGEIEYPESIVQSLGMPVVVNNTMEFDLAAILDSTGLKGFYNPGQNVYEARFRFTGDCDIQDGAVVSLSARGKDLCREDISSGKISSPPLNFIKDSLNTQEDIYDLSLEFSGDTLCGETFRMRAVWTSISPLTANPGQRISMTYKKELSFINQSYQAIRNVSPTLGGFDAFDAWEQLYFDIPNGVPSGDSIVILCEFERTCTGVCKPTDLRFEVLTPQEIGCPSLPTGTCNLRLNAQSWQFDSLILAPVYAIKDGQGELVRQPDGTEILQGGFTIQNLSSFEIKAPLIIEFYEDVNNDGRIDTGDINRARDTLDGSVIYAFESEFFDLTRIWPADAGCGWLALVSPLNNPCICEADTIRFPDLEIVPQSDTVRACYSNTIDVGFTSIAGYSYTWFDSMSITPNDAARGLYTYSGPMDKGSEITTTLLLHSERFGGCSVIDTVVVQLYRPVGSAAIMDTIRCHGEVNGSLSALLLQGEGRTRYLWSNGDTSSISTDLGAGNYSVIMTDEEGCVDTVDVVMSEPDPLEDSLNITTNYNGYPVKCHGDSTGGITIEVSGGTPGYTFEYNGVASNQNSFDGLTSGWTIVHVTDRYGCEITDSIFLDQPPPLSIVSSGTKAGCDEDHLASAMALAEGGTGGFRYTWSNGIQGDSTYGLDVGEHYVTGRDANGCEIMDTVIIERFNDPGISVNILDTVIQYGDIIRLHAQTNANEGTYMWFPEEKMSCDTCQTTRVSTLEDLIVEVRVVDENGCEAWGQISIKVEITKRVWAPNAITVNADNLNDGFTLFGNKTLELIQYLRIYDRWGELVFSKEAFEPGQPELGWHGDLNDETMNPAVFAWVAKVRFVDGEERLLFGDLTVIR